jgi:hypothetical protein
MLQSAIVAVALLAAWVLHAHEARRVQARYDDRLDQLLAAKNPDLEQLIALVDRLCQRVQAPSQAVIDHSLAAAVVPPSPPAVPFDDAEVDLVAS